MSRLMKSRRALLAVGILFGFAMLVLVSGCGKAAETSAPASNDTVVLGESTMTVGSDPYMLADGTSGSAVSGSEEDQAQQDRVSGGANAGSVTSVDKMGAGITAPPSDEASAPADSLLLLNSGKAPDLPSITQETMKSMPRSHVNAGLTIDLCKTCHKVQ